MRIVHVLIIALALTRLASADNFTFVFDLTSETGTVNNGFCGSTVVDFTFPGCNLDYSREEYLDPLHNEPNDAIPLFGTLGSGTVEVINTSNNIEALFVFGAFSHSLVESFLLDCYEGADDLLGGEFSPAASAYIVDDGSGQPQFLNEVNWADGNVDTFQVQFVPEASSVGLLSSVVLICGLLRRRDLLSGLRTLGLTF
jgi:hypothetical protein